MSTQPRASSGEFRAHFEPMRPLRAVGENAANREIFNDPSFVHTLAAYAELADRPGVPKADRDSARVDYQAALVDVLYNHFEQRPQDSTQSDTEFINGALVVTTNQLVRARMGAWEARSGSGWRRGFIGRRAPDWGAEAALPQGVYQIHNGRKDVSREGIDKVTRALLGMPPPESHRLRPVGQPSVEAGSKRPEKQSWLRRKTAVLAAVGALAVAGVGTALVGGELPGDGDSERAASGDQAAEVAQTNAAQRSFKQIGNVSILGAAKKQQMQIELFCDLNNIDLKTMSEADMNLIKAGKGSVLLKRIAAEEQQKPTTPKWKSIPGAPKEFWGQVNNKGDYQAFANPNDPNSNSIWAISELIADEYAGKEVSDKKVGRLTAAIKKLRPGKSELLQPKEKLSFPNQVLQRIIGSER